MFNPFEPHPKPIITSVNNGPPTATGTEERADTEDQGVTTTVAEVTLEPVPNPNPEG